MKTRLFSINFLLQNFLLFCIGIFTITSCKTDEVVKQAITGNSLKTRSLSTPSIPSNFFYSSDVGLSSIIETLQRIDSEVPFADYFLDEHGHLKNETIPDIVEALFTEQIIPYFCKEEPYKSYSFDNSLSISSLFSNIEVLTKNCK